jgi:hypothetical protein
MSAACWHAAMFVPTAIIPKQTYSIHSYTMSTDISLHHYVSTNSLEIKPVRYNRDNMQASQYTLSLAVSIQ